MDDCIFCKIASGKMPSTMVYSDDQVCVFTDLDPKAPVHYLAIPKMHINSAADIENEKAAVTGYLFEVIAKVTREKGISSFRVVTNCGEQAGQSVKHLHFHVLAGRDMSWPPG